MQRNHHDITQNSDEWDALRLGRFTASSFKELFSGKKTAAFEKAIYKPVFERMTGQSPDRFYGDFMKRGHDLEPLAIEQYETDNFESVDNGGFWTLGDWIGASPDGLVGSNGLFEGKAPAYNTHMNYLIKGELPKEYFWQVHGQLYVTDREWVDFYSYHPGIAAHCVRVHRDEKIESELIEKINECVETAQSVMQKLIDREAA